MIQRKKKNTTNRPFITLENDEVNALSDISQLEKQNEELINQVNTIKEVNEKQEKMNMLVRKSNNNDINKKLNLKNIALDILFELDEILGNKLNENYKEAFADGIDKFDVHNLEKLVETGKYNIQLAQQYKDEVKKVDDLKQKALSMLDKFDRPYSELHDGSSQTIETIKRKIMFVNDRSKLNELIELIKSGTRIAKGRDINAMIQLDKILQEPIGEQGDFKIYTSIPKTSPFKEKFDALNKSPIPYVIPIDIGNIDLTKPFNTSKIRNVYILDNLVLNNVIDSFEATDNKYKFIGHLMLKAGEAIGKTIKDAIVYLTLKQGKIIIESVVGTAALGLIPILGSQIKFKHNGKQTNLLEFGTQQAINTSIQTATGITKGILNGISESNVGQGVKGLYTDAKNKINDTIGNYVNTTQELINNPIKTVKKALLNNNEETLTTETEETTFSRAVNTANNVNTFGLSNVVSSWMFKLFGNNKPEETGFVEVKPEENVRIACDEDTPKTGETGENNINETE